jgi:hypothetical protein
MVHGLTIGLHQKTHLLVSGYVPDFPMVLVNRLLLIDRSRTFERLPKASGPTLDTSKAAANADASELEKNYNEQSFVYLQLTRPHLKLHWHMGLTVRL